MLAACHPPGHSADGSVHMRRSAAKVVRQRRCGGRVAHVLQGTPPPPIFCNPPPLCNRRFDRKAYKTLGTEGPEETLELLQFECCPCVVQSHMGGGGRHFMAAPPPPPNGGTGLTLGGVSQGGAGGVFFLLPRPLFLVHAPPPDRWAHWPGTSLRRAGGGLGQGSWPYGAHMVCPLPPLICAPLRPSAKPYSCDSPQQHPSVLTFVYSRALVEVGRQLPKSGSAASDGVDRDERSTDRRLLLH